MDDRLAVEDPSTDQQAGACIHNHARSLAGAGGTVDRRVRSSALQKAELVRVRPPSRCASATTSSRSARQQA